MFLLSIIGLLFIVLILGISAGTAHAGPFSFLGNLFGAGKSDASTYNSQNIPLLKAPSAADPKAATGGAVMNIVEDSSILPVVGPMGSLADFETYKLDQITTYTVREGDTLSEIGNMFSISINTIRWANNLKTSTVIRPGQILIILPIDSIQHTVAKGETLEGIVKKYGGDIDETLAFNGWLPGYEPGVGTIVTIPNGEGEPLTNSGTAVWGAGSPVYAGYYIRPINGGRISQGPHGFNGVDVAASCLTPVHASASGTVIVARNYGWNGGYGKYVVIVHPNGTQTVYAHLSQVFVSVGQYVSQGFMIGLIGSTGNSSGCHVHFEIRGAAQIY